MRKHSFIGFERASLIATSSGPERRKLLSTPEVAESQERNPAALAAEGWKRDPLLERSKDQDETSRPHIFRLPVPQSQRQSDDSTSTASSFDSNLGDSQGMPAVFETENDTHDETDHPSASSNIRHSNSKPRQKVTFRLPARRAGAEKRKNLSKTDKLHADWFSYFETNDGSVTDVAKNRWDKCRAVFGASPDPTELERTQVDITSAEPDSGHAGECELPGMQEFPGKVQVHIPELPKASPVKQATHEDEDLAELTLLLAKMCGGLKGWLQEHHPDFSSGRPEISQIVADPKPPKTVPVER